MAVALGIKIERSPHTTSQADGKTPLVVVGEVHTKFTRDGRDLYFDALVFEELDCEDIDPEGSAAIFDVGFSTSDGRQGDLPEKASGM